MMSSSHNAIHVPDELWAQFRSGEVLHFRYPAKHRGVAVYADGREVEFDSRVTPEMVDAEREKDRAELNRNGDRIFSCRMRYVMFTTRRPRPMVVNMNL